MKNIERLLPMKKTIYFVGLLLFSFQANAQVKPSFFDTLSSADEIAIILTLPLDSLHRTQKETIEGTITVKRGSRLLFKNQPLGIELRGKFRRMKCVDMPPLALNLKKGMLRKAGLKEYDNYKLVTHCLYEDDSAENLQEEHLCYQLYNQLTTFSYRILWLDITYIDATDSTRQIDHKALLIESDNDVENRLQLEESKKMNMNEDSIDFEQYSKIAAFNCLIGNKDWSIQSLRNCKLFYSEERKKYVPIPYDFDYANIVGPRYRREVLSENSTHPFDRLFTGEYFLNRSDNMLSELLPFEDFLLTTVENEKTGLRRGRKEKIRKYIASGLHFIKKEKRKPLPYGTIIPYQDEL